MSAQKCVSRAMLLYPSLPMVGAEYFRLKNICGCQKELDSKIDQNKEGLNLKLKQHQLHVESLPLSCHQMV